MFTQTLTSQQGTPEAAKIFVSAVSQTSVTISGPPTRLTALFRTSGYFRDRTHLPLPVYGGLCHAKHIYTQGDVEAVVQTRGLDSRFRPRAPVISTSTGKPFPVDSATELLKQIVFEILTQPITWDNVVQGIVEQVRNCAASEFQLMVFRISLPVNDLTNSLPLNIPNATVAKEDLISWLVAEAEEKGGPRTPMQSKLAIVGMACRMPGGADDPEKFWELLEKGLEVYRKIPADRFDVETHHDPTGKRTNTSHTAYGCFIDEPGLFVSPRQMICM